MYAAWPRDKGTGFMTHMIETRSEMQHNVHAYGKTAMQRLNDLGGVGARRVSLPLRVGHRS